MFRLGDVVCLRSDHEVHGAVIDVMEGGPETRYVVFHGTDRRTYYESQLRLLSDESVDLERVSLGEFRARLSALRLEHPGPDLFSLHAGRIDFVPHQFKPVLRLIRADRPRLLIADEVGVGKTIEAGLIMKELQARTPLETVLVACPKALVSDRKWSEEMRRFDEDFVELDGASLRYCLEEAELEGAWPERYRRAILPFSLLGEKTVRGDGRLGLAALDPIPRIDLLVVDEAHHLRNGETYTHQGIRLLAENAGAVLFLTATPIHLGSRDLFTLLNVLRPDLIRDEGTLEDMCEPNPHLYRASEIARRGDPAWQATAAAEFEGALSTPWGRRVLADRPEADQARRLLAKGGSDEDRVRFIRTVEELNTLSGLINRTRRRDIGTFTTRKPRTVRVAFTPAQSELHTALLNAQAEIYRRTHGDPNVNFFLSTLRRQASSCLFGLAPLIEAILSRGLLEIESGPYDDFFPSVSMDILEAEVRGVVEMAESLSPDDPKLDALLELVEEKQGRENNKVLLFTSFRHTLRYLEEQLGSEDVRVGVIHGHVDDRTRYALRRRFSLGREDPDAIDLLLSSEVGCEGLDYQFCDMLVNYDLPWNPAQIEQRIGRIDRYGQASETVAVVNFVVADTVDADIYDRCLTRIGIFRQALGGSEEVLGRIHEQIALIAENLTLTSDERAARLQQLADNEVRFVEESQELEARQAELFGLAVPDTGDGALRAASGPGDLENLVLEYFARLGIARDCLLGQGLRRTLRLGREPRDRLLEDYKGLTRRRSRDWKAWERWLKGGDPHLALTFDRTEARDDRDVAFITPFHPLVQQAVVSFRGVRTPFVAVRVPVGGSLPPGEHEFAVYLWEKRGVREEALLEPVADDQEVVQVLRAALGDSGLWVEADGPEPPSNFTRAELDALHHITWSTARDRHRAESLKLIRKREESLRASSDARERILLLEADSASHANIRRMKEAQLRTLQEGLAMQLAELAAAQERADLVATPVAYGILTV